MVYWMLYWYVSRLNEGKGRFGMMGFGMFQLLFGVVFLFVIGMFIATAVRGIGQWNKNNNSPRLTVEATLVAKRTHVSHHHHGGEHHHHHSSTSYYLTFEVASGDRMEFHVKSNDYALLVEGDRGQLTFQGTRYLGFERGY